MKKDEGGDMSLAEVLMQESIDDKEAKPEKMSEKRRHPRFAYKHSALVIGHGMRKAYITDISAEGIGLVIKEGNISPREYIRLYMLEDETNKMFTLSGTVRYVEGTHCGIQLIRPERENSEIYQRLLMNAKLNESRDIA